MRFKLQTRYLFFILSGIIITVIALTSAVLIQFRSTLLNATSSSSEIMKSNLLKQLEKRGQLMALFASEELVNPLYQYDMDTIHRTCAAVRKLKDVIYVYVYDPEGRIVHDGTGSNPYLEIIFEDNISKKAVAARSLIIQTTEDTLDVAIPINIQNEIIGGVRIGLSMDGIKAENAKMINALERVSDDGLKQTLISVVVIAALLSACGLIFGAFLARHLSRPISFLSTITKRIGKGEYDVEIPIERSDEIGELSNSFRKMANDLRKTTVSKTYVDNIIKNMIDMLIVINTDGTIKTVNKATCDLMGFEEIDLLGHEIDRIIKKEEVLGEASYDKFIEKGAVATYETTFHGNKGNIIPVLLSSSVIRDGKGEIEGIVVIASDIRQIKEAEEVKHRLESQLREAQKMEALGTLAGGVAHDLNNILSGLVSYPELLLLDIPHDSPLRKPMLTIKESGEKAAKIVQDLLTLARRGVSVLETINLNHIIIEHLESLEFKKLKSYHPHIQVKTKLEKNLLNIEGSPVHLAKTVMNLISNASEAMPYRGDIFLSTKNRYIDVPGKGYDDIEEGDYVVLTVSDSGIGISSEDVERIFEPFYTKKVMGRSGTGLGMAVVWGTVKDHRGYIDVQSIEGKGTIFTLYFPVSRHELPAEKTQLSIEDLMGRGESVLIVDDVDEQRTIASGILIKLGYSVSVVSSGEEAIEYMQSNSADLLVLDMIMDPGIDGLETYKRILEFHPGQKAIIASGFSETDRVQEAQKLGAGSYVKKPYTIEKIGIAVRDELNK